MMVIDLYFAFKSILDIWIVLVSLRSHSSTWIEQTLTGFIAKNSNDAYPLQFGTRNENISS
jgi:hypothetical protein